MFNFITICFCILSNEQSLISFTLQYELLDSDWQSLARKITDKCHAKNDGNKDAQKRVEDYEKAG